jgi:ribose 5-phosphate isomerase A
MTAAEHALESIADGMVVGLGSGRAATQFVQALGERVRQGLSVRGVPTSRATGELAKSLAIPLVSLDDVGGIDVDVDGADEVDPRLNLIKGLGGALVREKIVAAASRRVIILVGPEKLVPVLGSHGILPVEIVPFGLALCRRRLAALGCPAEVRLAGNGQPVISDNGNLILDCRIGLIVDPNELDRNIKAVPGVVDTGFFLDLAQMVLIQRDEEVETRVRQ